MTMLGRIQNRLKVSEANVLRLSWFLIAVVFLTVGTLILSVDVLLPDENTFQLEVEDIASEDIFAPYDLTYNSDVLLEERRQRARENAGLRYVDLPNVRTNQRNLMNDILAYIDLVRENPYSSEAQKVEDLQAITAMDAITETRWRSILETSDEEWAAMDTEIRQLLDRTIERRLITDTDVQEAIATLDIRGSFLQAQDRIIIALVSQLIVPTEAIDEEATRIAQDNAAAAIEEGDAQNSYKAGDPIVFRRDVVTDLQIEALDEYGLLQQNENVGERVMGSMVVLLLLMVVVVSYIGQFHPSTLQDYPMLGMIAFLFLEFLLLARLFVDNVPIYPVFPAAALAILAMSLVGVHLSTILTAALAILAAMMVEGDNSLEFALLIIAGGFAGVLSFDNQERTDAYFKAAIVIGLVTAVAHTAMTLLTADGSILLIIVTGGGLAILGGFFAAGVAFVQLGVISTLMNLPTSLRLIDLARNDQPALKQLLREAPGTFQHSLQVANLAELAAERIGLNTTLVRVAAMYHDIGKTLNPHFFVENQRGFNPHDTIQDPKRSAQILIGHVTEGDRMARRFRLPQRIRDFIREHHGTSKPYFYYKAVELAGGDVSKVDATDFTYPGPIPQSKETGVLKLADSIESAARSIQPTNREEITGVVDMIFQRELQDGQLDESHLTLNDLKQIREVFIDTLEGIYHTRIKYPGQESGGADRQIAPPKPKPIEGSTPAAIASAVQQPLVKKTSEVKSGDATTRPKSPRSDEKRRSQEQNRKTGEIDIINDDVIADELTQEVDTAQKSELPTYLDPVSTSSRRKPSRSDEKRRSQDGKRVSVEMEPIKADDTAKQDAPQSTMPPADTVEPDAEVVSTTDLPTDQADQAMKFATPALPTDIPSVDESATDDKTPRPDRPNATSTNNKPQEPPTDAS